MFILCILEPHLDVSYIIFGKVLSSAFQSAREGLQYSTLPTITVANKEDLLLRRFTKTLVLLVKLLNLSESSERAVFSSLFNSVTSIKDVESEREQTESL